MMRSEGCVHGWGQTPCWLAKASPIQGIGKDSDFTQLGSTAWL